MTKRSSHEAPKSAAELMKALRNNPDYQARIASKNRDRMRATADAQLSSALVLDDLRKIGIDVASLDELRTGGRIYAAAIPLLVSWLGKVDDDRVKEALVRTLSVPWASEEAEGPLIDLYLSLDTNKSHSLKWAIGNALSVISTGKYLDQLLEIVLDKRHGTTRQMIILGLANVFDDRSEGVLIDLLTDPEVAGHAIMALGKCGREKAAARLKPLSKYTTPWVRAEAKKALSMINDRLALP